MSGRLITEALESAQRVIEHGNREQCPLAMLTQSRLTDGKQSMRIFRLDLSMQYLKKFRSEFGLRILTYERMIQKTLYFLSCWH